MSSRHFGVKIASSAVIGYFIGGVLAKHGIPATFSNILISWVILFPFVVLKDVAIDKLLD